LTRPRHHIRHSAGVREVGGALGKGESELETGPVVDPSVVQFAAHSDARALAIGRPRPTDPGRPESPWRVTYGSTGPRNGLRAPCP